MSTYGKDIRAFATRATTDQSSKVTRAIGLRVLTGVVLRTPVDTGRARANWQADVGSGKNGEVDAEDKGGAGTIAAGAGVIGKQKGFEPLALTNNLPYIGDLEDGSSKQAPSGMVAETLADMGLSPGRSS